MHQVNIHKAKTNLSKLIQEVLNGNEVIIAKNRKPIIKLIDIQATENKRKLGLAKDKIFISDSFDESLEDFKEYM
ncbi:MAG: type II toxin-antitoxin system prevent-host-death family antitoxin [Melioribacteraceae bacterium]